MSNITRTRSIDKGQLTDSNLVIRQLDGTYEAQGMKYLKDRAIILLSDIRREVDKFDVTFQHVVADRLTNEAMDNAEAGIQ